MLAIWIWAEVYISDSNSCLMAMKLRTSQGNMRSVPDVNFCLLGSKRYKQRPTCSSCEKRLIVDQSQPCS